MYYNCIIFLIIFAALALLYIKSHLLTKCSVLIILFCSLILLIINNKKENFTNIIDAIKNFEEQQTPLITNLADSLDNGISNENANAINENLDKLNSNMQLLLQEITKIKPSSKDVNITYNNSDEILTNVEVYKRLQLKKLEDLQSQLQKLKQMHSDKLIQDNTNKYKPIPIYNSCVINNAEGSYSD